jgi:ABC-type dipeptide/oligopeptide/nickel transport system ATPase component
VTVQAQVLRVMGDLRREFGTALIMITHDLGVIADLVDDVVVMCAGAVMERADRRSIFSLPPALHGGTPAVVAGTGRPTAAAE